MIALASLCLGSSVAWASISCSGGNQTFTLALPSTVSVPRDAPVGSVLTSWVLSPASTGLFSCRVTGDNGLVYAYAGSLFTVNSNIRPAGGEYGNPVVFNTNVPGIGMAIAGNVYVGGSGYGWWGWARAQGGTLLTYGGYGPATYSYSPGAQIAVALVKTSAVVTAGGQVSGGQVAFVYPATYSTNYFGQSAKYLTTPVTIVPLSCSTPNVNVPLGSHRKSEFTGVSSTTRNVNFNFAVNGCPSDLGHFGPAIQYKVEAVTAILNSSQSVVALDSSSEATGIGVQLLDGNGVVFPLNTYKTFSGYNGATGGSYNIPFQARYYQAAATVSPGKANTSMTITMLYQ